MQNFSGVINAVTAINGADGTPVVAGQTVARDKMNIITGTGVLINLDEIGTNWLANDTGGAIKGYRIDLYKGTGKAVCDNYDNIITVGTCSPGSATCPASTLE